MPQIIVGCDLSRAFIDVCINAGRRTSRIENTKSGITQWIVTLGASALVVFEATSGCDAVLMQVLAEHGVTYARVNPRQAREFARALGVLAKADKVDAGVLAQMGQRLPPDHHQAAGATKRAARRFPQATQAVGRSPKGREAAPA